MNVFDLFRSFFGVPRGHDFGRRDPFDDDDDEEEEEEDGFYSDWYQEGRQHPFDDSWKFHFDFLWKRHMGHWDGHQEPGLFDAPGLIPPPYQHRIEEGGWGSSGNPLRDSMLKIPDSEGPQQGSFTQPGHDGLPYSRGQGPGNTPQVEHKEDRDLDSAVSSGGLEEILSPPAAQPRIRSFFRSVTVTKVVKPDGTVEEKRTVRDSQGNVDTTVTRSGGPGSPEGPEDGPGSVQPDGQHTFSDLRDESLFSKFFGFK